jgi:hypothetical protein
MVVGGSIEEITERGAIGEVFLGLRHKKKVFTSSKHMPIDCEESQKKLISASSIVVNIITYRDSGSVNETVLVLERLKM